MDKEYCEKLRHDFLEADKADRTTVVGLDVLSLLTELEVRKHLASCAECREWVDNFLKSLIE